MKVLTITDRYIMRRFVTTLVFSLMIFMVIIVVFDMVEKLDEFLKHDLSTWQVIREYYLIFIPYFISTFLAFFTFISAIFFTSRMAYAYEIIAIENAGMSPLRMLVPYLIVAIGVAGLSYYLNGWFLPRHAGQMILFEAQYLSRPYHYREVNIHRQISPQWYLYLEEYNNRDSIAYKMSLEKFEGKVLRYKVTSHFARWSGADSAWVLHTYRIRRWEGRRMRVRSGKELSVRIPLTPTDFEKSASLLQVMTNPQLRRRILELQLKGAGEARYAAVELAKRQALPAAAIVLVVIAFSMASRQVRGGMGMHLGMGLLIGFSYIVFLQISATAAIKADLSPFWGAWLPNVAYSLLAVWLLYRRARV